MKRNASLIMIFFLIAGLTVIAPAYGEDTNEDKVSDEIAAFNGLWIGSGKFRMSSSQYVSCPAGREMQIYFIVQDGKVWGPATQNLTSFETEIKKNGKIKFIYKNIGTVQLAGGGTDPISMVFSGKLEGSSGKGRVTYWKCRGEWEVHRQE